MKNPKRLDGEKFNVINLILAIALAGSVFFVIYSSSKNKLKTATELSEEKSNISNYDQRKIDLEQIGEKIKETQAEENKYSEALERVEKEKQDLLSDANTDSFTCPEDYDDPQKYAEELVESLADYKDLDSDELMKKRYETLLSNGCKTSLFNIHSQGVMDPMIKFNGKEYGPPVSDVDEDSEVRSVYYPLSGQQSGEDDEEIIFNFYIQDVWGEEPFTTSDVAQIIADSDGQNNNHILYKFQAPDPINKKPAFYFYTNYIPDENTLFIVIAKVASVGRDVYSISFSRKILESEKDQTISDLYEEVANKYFKILGTKIPTTSLEKVFDRERESNKQIQNNM